MELKKVYFISGIDTDAGKSFVTGALARMWRECGKSVITQKFIQTGCDGISEDIELHRKIMRMELLPEDLDHTTCPVRFTYPASPDLASRIDSREIDFTMIQDSTQTLLESYDTILLEGAGGLLVPLVGLYTTLDYIEEYSMPLILVTNPKLGSINHTFLSLEVCRSRGVVVDKLVYNMYPQTSPEITNDTRNILRAYLGEYHPDCEFIEIPFIEL